jgi:hypothetical protein
MSEIATESIGVSSPVASDRSGLAYAGFWRRKAAAILDLCLVWFCCTVVWALLAFGIGDPMRLSDMFGIGATDKCGPWRVVTHTFESDALERAERLCVTTTFGLWPSSWIEHQEAHRRLDSQLRGLRDLILGRLSPGAKAANKARLSGPAPP